MTALVNSFSSSNKFSSLISGISSGMITSSSILTSSFNSLALFFSSSSLAISSIAFESGFNNYSHFYRLFYRKHQISPSEWRNIILEKPILQAKLV